ncbi:hypothetical protein QTO34_010876 [Cnephaeus nilssonii]|uniref:Adhesion G protein-coupled receptor G3 n=1 Tax=Cnephaeus nilssonii TaxID=3371016 RepID=A0AA40LEQ1_CNENI|nr:hypothetical protein QTO34_010876 [Eptesicus nilssonii]
MVPPRAPGALLPPLLPLLLLLLLLLLLASGEKDFTNNSEQTTKSEQPRNVCMGLINQDHYEPFDLMSTAECFKKCAPSGNSSCHLGNLQRYWLDYETYLVEGRLRETVDLPFLKAVVRNVSTSTAGDLHFSLSPSQIPGQVTEDKHKFPDRVRLPRSLFAALQGSRPVVPLAVSVLDVGPGSLFKGPQLSLEDEGSVLNNRLVGLSLGGMRVTALQEPVEITFSHPRQPPNMTLTCVFWDVTKGSTGDWSSKGCSTEPGAQATVCRCDHLTFFSLLLVTAPPPCDHLTFFALLLVTALPPRDHLTFFSLLLVTAPPPRDHLTFFSLLLRPVLNKATVQALTRISQVGCGASMVFLAFTVVFYVALRFSWKRFKSEDAPKIHVALSVSLFLVNLAFFVNVGHGPKGSHAACVARGAVSHYLLLCVFTWMALESFHLHLLVIRVFNTYFGHYFLKLSLVGWGLPVLMVIGTGSANSYGLYTIRDEENRTTLELCWFRRKAALYATVHGYFLVTFLFSAVVLGLLAWKIFTLSSATAGKEQRRHWKGVLTLLGLSSLVGMTWGLAILTPLGLATIYIFALFNSLQGVFIFCWFIVLYFPSQSTAPSSGTARAEQTHVASQ